MMVVLSIVFSNMFKFDVEYFPVYLLSGQLIFNFFNEATTNAMGAIVMNGPLIKNRLAVFCFDISHDQFF